MTGGSGGTRTVQAPAKVNLSLRVLGARQDGYHDLQTLIVPISLADRLEVHAEPDVSFATLSLSLEVTGDPELVAGVPIDQSNLALKAAAALSEATGVRGFANMTLEKRVPSAAGLGGGSADAAAVLSVLNDLWGCGLDPEGLRRVGAAVGSDVPALMVGGPTIAEGRGERVRPVTCRPLRLVLVTLRFAVSTPDAFAWWDQDGSTGPELDPLLDAASNDASGAFVRGILFNDLEGPVGRRHPEILRTKDLLLRAGVQDAAMSGSGPTVFGIMPSGEERLDARTEAAITERSGWPPRYVQSLSRPGELSAGS